MYTYVFVCVCVQSCRVSTPRKLFDDAQRPKIETFIKNLRELAWFSASRAGEINLFLAAM